MNSLVKNFNTPTLNGIEDYPVWAFTIERHLKTLNLERYIGIVSDPTTDVKDVPAEENKATSILLETISKTEIRHIMYCTKAKDIWDHFKKSYGQKTGNLAQELHDEVRDFNCSNNEDVLKMLSRGLAIKGQLQSLNHPIADQQLIGAMIKALPSQYDSFKTNWRFLDDKDQSLERLLAKLRAASRDKETTNNQVAMLAHNAPYRGAYRQQNASFHTNYPSQRQHPINTYNTQTPTYRPPQDMHNTAQIQRTQQRTDPRSQSAPTNQVVCHYCKNIGHIKIECQKLMRRRQYEAERGHTAHFSQITSNQNTTAETPNTNTAVLGYNQNNNQSSEDVLDLKGICFMATILTDDQHLSKQATTWVVDSGASAHMSPRLDLMVNYQTFDKPVNIKIANDSAIPALGTGQIQTNDGYINNVHYVPALGTNLYSLTAAADAGLQIQADKEYIKFFHKGIQVQTATRMGGTYTISFTTIKRDHQALLATDLINWHKRYAHLPIDLVKKMRDEGIVDGLRIAREGEDCIDCKLNKCRRASHPTRTTPKATRAAQVLHLDVMGPIQPMGISEQRFILCCKDEFSGYRYAIAMQSKAKVPEATKLFINQAILETNNEVVAIVTDNGSEFKSERLSLFLQYKGIKQNFSAPYTPQQNGTAERENQSLLKQARVMLNGSSTRLDLWPEAVMAATYVNNRSITRDRPITPFELWHGRKPNVKNLRIFGQKASVMLNDHAKGKWALKGAPMTFVGYADNHNTYRFFDPATNKITVSCDATFINTSSRLVSDTLEDDTSSEDNTSSENNTTNFNFESTDEEPTTTTINNDAVASQSEHELTSNLTTNGSQSRETLHTPTINTVEQQPRMVENNPTVAEDQSQNEATFTNNDQSRQTATPSGNDGNDSNGHEGGVHNEEADSSRYESVINDTDDQHTNSQQPTHSTPLIQDRLRTTKQIDYKKMAQGCWNLSALCALSTTPNTHKQAIESSDKELWVQAMKKELQSIEDNQVFQLVNRPPNTNIVTCRWVFSTKKDTEGRLIAKARLVARGFSQQFGLDYSITYSPVAYMSIIRFLFAVAADRKMSVAQFDIQTAFLNGTLEENVYMHQPEGFNDGTSRVWKLRKSLYGLKQAPRVWYEKLSEFFVNNNYQISKTDNCIFFKIQPRIIVAVHVDDGIIFAEDRLQIDILLQQLASNFKIHIMKTNKFLGFQYHVTQEGIHLQQSDYIKEIVARFNLADAHAAETPMTPGQMTDISGKAENIPYREAIGALQFAAITTRPDISFAVNKLSRKVEEPTTADWSLVKRCFRYLKGTPDLGIHYKHASDNQLRAYSDADYVGCKQTYKSTSGILITYAEGPVVWRSKLQKHAATSTTEAELFAISDTTKEATVLRSLYTEILDADLAPIELNCDNKGAVLVMANDMQTQRTRHIGAHLSYTKQQHRRKVTKVQQIPATEQLADWLTKPLPTSKFIQDRSKLMSFILTTITLLSLLTGCIATDCGELQELNTVKWLKTKHLVARGKNEFELRIELKNPCHTIKRMKDEAKEKMLNIIKFAPEFEDNYTLPQLTTLTATIDKHRHMVNILNQMAGNCTLFYQQNQSKGFKRLLAASNCPQTQVRAKREASLPGAILCSIPIGCSLYEYFKNDSAYNTVWRNEKRIELLEAAFNEARTFASSSLKAQSETVELLQQTQEIVGNLTNFIPTLIWHSIREGFHIYKQQELYEQMARRIRRNEIDIEALVQLTGREDFTNLDNEDTRVKGVTCGENSLSIKFTVPRLSKDTAIKRAFTFKVWKSNTSYLKYVGPAYAIVNETANCSRLIDEPKTKLIYNQCTDPNTTTNAMKQTYWSFEQTDTTLDNVQILDAQTHIVIQCFPNTINFGNCSQTCPMRPFRIDMSRDFVIGTTVYRYQNVQSIFANETVEQSTLVENIADDSDFKAIHDELNVMTETNDKMNKIWNGTRTWQEVITEYGYGIGSIGGVGILLGICCVVYLVKRNPLAEAIEKSALASIAGSTMSLHNQPSAPMIINIDNNNSDRLYPRLTDHRVHFYDKQDRETTRYCANLTPYASSKSLDTSERVSFPKCRCNYQKADSINSLPPCTM